MPHLSESSTLKDITVRPLQGGSVEISWESASPVRPVLIYAGENPEAINTSVPVARVERHRSVRISTLPPGRRYYFELVPDGSDGHRYIAGTRQVQMEGAVNFRDMGGYPTCDGKRVRWGHIFRSDALSRLTDSDRKRLTQMKIQTVCDFRSPAEALDAPDRLPEDGRIQYLHLPVTHGEFDFIVALERLRRGDADWLTDDFMIRGYLRNIDTFAHVWAEVLTRASEARQRPLVFHCTGGKDRAGTCAALLLLVLGVPEETVVADHQLSNIYIADLLESVNRQVESWGVDPKKMAPYFTAPLDCIIALIEHIRKRYGSAEGYLATRAGMHPETIDRLRRELLEDR